MPKQLVMGDKVPVCRIIHWEGMGATSQGFLVE